MLPSNADLTDDNIIDSVCGESITAQASKNRWYVFWKAVNSVAGVFKGTLEEKLIVDYATLVLTEVYDSKEVRARVTHTSVVVVELIAAVTSVSTKEVMEDMEGKLYITLRYFYRFTFLHYVRCLEKVGELSVFDWILSIAVDRSIVDTEQRSPVSLRNV